MTSSLRSLSPKSSPSLVHELASDAVMRCEVELAGSITAMTAIGIVMVVDAGAFGAAAKVAGAPSTWIMSALPKDPVQDGGVLIVTLPVTRSTSPVSWLQVPLSTGTLVVAPCGALTDPVARARATIAALPSAPAGPVAPMGPAGPV